jgi:hypothetical protein
MGKKILGVLKKENLTRIGPLLKQKSPSKILRLSFVPAGRLELPR